MKGLGQAVLLCGEDGTGKSRLVRELASRLGLDGDALLAARCSAGEASPVVTALLGDTGAAALQADARTRVSDLVVSRVLAQAARHPVLVVVEDAHWADPSTMEVLGDLLASIDDARVLFVVTFRPSLRPPWELRSHVSHLSLDPSTRSDAEVLLAEVAPASRSPSTS